MMKYFFETYGCEMNIAESAAVEQLFLSRGWQRSENPETANAVVINTCSVFGGIDIYVKEDTKVLIKSTSLFGGVENKKKTETNDKSKTIYINAFCMFGGVDIK